MTGAGEGPALTHTPAGDLRLAGPTGGTKAAETRLGLPNGLFRLNRVATAISPRWDRSASFGCFVGWVWSVASRWRSSEVAKDYIRTCKRCRHQRRLSKATANERAPGALTMLGARSTVAGLFPTVRSRSRSADQLRLAQVEAKQARALAAATCPACGSSSLTQRSESSRSRAKALRQAAAQPSPRASDEPAATSPDNRADQPVYWLPIPGDASSARP